jgi:hypothetical protein
MAIRIVGVDLPQNKRGEIALTYIYGIGRSSSAKILDKAGVSRDMKVKEWTDDQAAKIREIIGNEFKVEGDLRSESSDEHQTSDGYWMLSWCSSSYRSYPFVDRVQRTMLVLVKVEEDSCKQEESY